MKPSLHNQTLRKQAGLSLIELMISITLGLILMAGVVQMFVSSKSVFTTQQSMSRIQETGRLAIEFLSRDIRMAGFYGCFRPNAADVNRRLQNDALVIDSLHGNFGEAIRGYASKGDLTATERAYLTSAEIQADTNVLVVRSASPMPRIINASNTDTTLQVFSTQAQANDCVDGLCKNDAAVVSDCFRARVFEVSALNDTSPNLVISHSDTWNIATDHTASYSSGEVLPMNTTSYFIATGVGGAPSLWQKLNQRDAVEVLEGVEKIVYKFSTEDNATYREAALISDSDWNMVNSVRIFVVARSIENNAVPEPQPYVIDGVTTTPVSPDRYMRQIFTATIGLRSRAATM
jgi:type IV pilus assembly protein PilW